MNLIKRKNQKGDKITFYYDFGREKGQRPLPVLLSIQTLKMQLKRRITRKRWHSSK